MIKLLYNLSLSNTLIINSNTVNLNRVISNKFDIWVLGCIMHLP